MGESERFGGDAHQLGSSIGASQASVCVHGRGVPDLHWILRKLDDFARGDLSRGRRDIFWRPHSLGKGTARSRPQAASPWTIGIAMFSYKASGKTVHHVVEHHQWGIHVTFLVHHKPLRRIRPISTRCFQRPWRRYPCLPRGSGLSWDPLL